MKTFTALLLLPVLLSAPTLGQRTFRNPILDELAPDPCIIKHEGFYYMVYTQHDRIEVLKSPILSNFRNAERREVFHTPPNRFNLWAPELHYIQGNLYIYFTMDDGVADENHRMYVIKADDPRNPLGNWSAEKRVTQEEMYAIDGTVLQHKNGKLYFLWTGFSIPPGKMEIYIAEMDDPMTVSQNRSLLRSPSMDWEMHDFPVNEGPFFIQNQDRTFMIFSGSSTFVPDYCLGIMGFEGDKDPMNPDNWWNDVRHCVFQRNDAEGVFTTGHASFVRSPDDSELWMVYHGVDTVDDRGQHRYARIQKIEWEMNGPVFPTAVGRNTDLVVPSGEERLFHKFNRTV